ncbi:NAD(P)/FAD-dependent oxidoreductase [Roseicitreum antarcticum]|uniref:Glycine/D-amino acid oxidase n=1 Tax=Roseicitreum antarcticum TaxID=564137 RepID=A0A1H2RKX9_9RHOB|nr:FAD-binding oxidoreductase [Roseicitreum antarcticum]SDW19918.1 Glycine/D-amino acid oxidase [Roseicitreum antarcticum]
MTSGEVTICGAGVFGLSLAYVCALRGAQVRVLEPYAVGAGSSGGIVGALAPHVPENWNAKKAFQFDSLRMAQGFWTGVADVSGVDPGYARLGRVQPLGPGAVEAARARAGGAQALWEGFADWHVLPVGDAPGLGVVSPSGIVVVDSLSARLHPRRAVGALAAAVRALGGVVEEGGIPPGAAAAWMAARLAGARGPVVWASGDAGLRDLSADLGRDMGGGVKGQALLLDFSAPDCPQVFADGLHIIPHADGTVAVGSTSERVFDDPISTDAGCDALLARAVAACPALAGARVLERWAGVRPRARSRAPMLGAWPGRPGHFVLNGGFKIGFGMAPKLAHVMADLVLGVDGVPEGFRVEDSM